MVGGCTSHSPARPVASEIGVTRGVASGEADPAPSSASSPCLGPQVVPPRSQLAVVNAEPVSTLGHGPEGRVGRILISPASRSTYLELVADSRFPDGTWILAEELSSIDGPVARSYVMHRTKGTWEFGGLAGTEAASPFTQAECRGCHAQAPSDFVFGLPRALREASPAANSYVTGR